MQKPIIPGTIVITAPATPDLAGKPTFTANYPLQSYMPQLFITDKQFYTVSLPKICLPVNGLIPPFARVAATIDIVSVSLCKEQH